MKPTSERGRTGTLKHYPVRWRIDPSDERKRVIVTGILHGVINVWARDLRSALRTARKECCRGIPSAITGRVHLTVH